MTKCDPSTPKITRANWLGDPVRFLSLPCILVAAAVADADEPILSRQIGGETYSLKLLFQDDFRDLDDWLIESTGKVTVKDNWLWWDCVSGGRQAGTIWCRRKFAGPTVVEFDAVGALGARNLNFILYASHPQGLLATTRSRSGDYGQYHQFPNYIVTYLTPREADQEVFSETKWRIRFRQNPGFHLLSERFLETSKQAGRRQRMTYVLADGGQMKLFADGQLLHEFTDRSSPYRTGYHGFRTWNSLVRYANFRVYSIVGHSQP